ncbi:hypothetical protein Ancab_027450 [Ancistrocladus abbreviatus]
MEEKRREDASQAAASSAKFSENPASEQVISRRRGGGLKRKAATSNLFAASSTPSKRQAREKVNWLLPPVHNGPLTRARQLSDNAATSSLLNVVKNELSPAVSQPDLASGELVGEVSVGKEEFQALVTAIEAEFEAIRSRDASAHVVPVPAGWFSWTKIHPIEKKALPSFFNGKSESRTPEIYMEIRNWIMKKFHSNPSIGFELKDLSDLSMGNMDARQEVMEFLDHWGLINYHPFPPKEAANVGVNVNADGDKPESVDSLIEKLYQFENQQSDPQMVPRANLSARSVPAGFFPESAIAEELAKQEGPSVEYHCNTCSADCSRKRYHCQKQADFDLCPECYNNGKFGSGMSPSDFILMEPAEASGASGGRWTDQETLLLLEALELYKENWNEIAEHVATKTKSQCILHFLQMPIEDSFLEGDKEEKDDLQENADPSSANKDASVIKDASEASESRTGASEIQHGPSPMGTSHAEDLEDAKDVKETGENFALTTLKEAFEAVGSPLTSKDKLSFAQAGNPVVALMLFLMRLVEPATATAAACSALKLISGSSPSMQLAARHCFLLEDPADDKKQEIGSDSAVDQGMQGRKLEDKNQTDVDGNEEIATRKSQESSIQVLDSSDITDDHMNAKVKDSAPEENTPVTSRSEDETLKKSEAAEKADESINLQQVSPEIMDESENPNLQKDQPPSDMKSDLQNNQAAKDVKDPADLQSKVEHSSDSVKELREGTSSVKHNEHKEATEDVDMELPKDVDIESGSIISEKTEIQEPGAVDSVAEDGAKTGEDQTKDAESGDPKSSETKDDHIMDKLKRAVVTTIAAAAVKAKLLAKQEEDEIRQLATLLVDKQLRKLEMKMTFFTEMDNAVMRVREHLERSRMKLYHERSLIIASRLGLPASAARAIPQSLSTNRMPLGFANSMPRPPLSMHAQRPPLGPLSRPVITSAPAPPTSTSSPCASAVSGGSPMQPSSQ